MGKFQEHAHKYVRIKLGEKGYKVYRCIKPGCPHYIRTELVVGKIFECWRCGGEFVMNLKTAQLKKPHCVSCTRPYGESQPPVVDTQELVKRVLGGNRNG